MMETTEKSKLGEKNEEEGIPDASVREFAFKQEFDQADQNIEEDFE